MSERDWLRDIKEGDEVWLASRWNAGRIVKVTRLTPTQVVIDGEVRFRRDSGRLFGRSDSWSVPYIRQVTAEAKEAIERGSLISWVRGLSDKRSELSLDALRAMKAAYEANKGK